MEAVTTITPIFLLIGLGWFARTKGFIPPEFLAPANRLTYYFAIPALLFRAISRASLHQQFHSGVLLATLGAALCAYAVAWSYCRFSRVPPQQAGGIIQSAGHGNLGYIGLPFAFYFLGDGGLVKAGIISGFLMILQNILSITALQAYATAGYSSGGLRNGVKKLLTNPVILSSLAGIVASALSFSLPQVGERTLDMLAGLAPPMSLLLIGASISVRAMRERLSSVVPSVFVKLLLLPAIGLLLFNVFRFPAVDYLPGLILLCCPTATVAYVMAKEMRGDADLVIAAISTSTLFSMVSFLMWLLVAGQLS